MAVVTREQLELASGLQMALVTAAMETTTMVETALALMAVVAPMVGEWMAEATGKEAAVVAVVGMETGVDEGAVLEATGMRARAARRW